MYINTLFAAAYTSYYYMAPLYYTPVLPAAFCTMRLATVSPLIGDTNAFDSRTHANYQPVSPADSKAHRRRLELSRCTAPSSLADGRSLLMRNDEYQLQSQVPAKVSIYPTPEMGDQAQQSPGTGLRSASGRSVSAWCVNDVDRS